MTSEEEKVSSSPRQQSSTSGKLFKKCQSATFQIDGATYTIGECLNI